MSTKQYIGSRYVPLFAEPIQWDSTKEYEALTIVLHEGNSYTSRQPVPVGIDIANEQYWAETGNYNAQIEQYRNETRANTDKLAAMGIDTTQDATDFLNRLETLDTDNEINKNRLETLDTDNEINKSVLKAAFGDDTVEAAGTSFQSNYMDIRKLGCKPGDASIDNAALINAWLATNPSTDLYVPDGEWDISTTLEIKTGNIFMSGWFKCADAQNLTDSTMVYCHASDETVSSAMGKAKQIKLKLDGNMCNVIGAKVKGYFASDIDIMAQRCMGGSVETVERNIENNFVIRSYGGFNNEPNDFMFRIAHNDNDNQATVIGRNSRIGIDLDSSFWEFGYVHVWGCDTGIKLHTGTANTIQYYYPDYCRYALQSQGTDAPSPILNIDTVMGICPSGSWFVKYDTSMRVNVRYFHLNLSGNRTYLSAFADGSLAGVFSNFNIGFDSSVVIDKDDLMDMDDDDFANKYGLFKWQNIVPGLKLVLLPYVDGTWNPTEFKDTKAGQRIVASGFPIAPENGFGVGRNGFEVTRHIVRNGAYPVPNYFIATAYSSNLQQKWDMIHHQYSTYNLTNFNPA